MLFGSLASRGSKGTAAMRRRCRRYLAGDWEALLRDAPSALSPTQRAGIAEEAAVRRGYDIDPRFEQACLKMQDGRPSQSVQGGVQSC